MANGAVQGVVYLVLILASVAATWIGILHVRLKHRTRELIKARKLIDDLRRAVATLRARAEAEELTDAELLADVDGILRDG